MTKTLALFLVFTFASSVFGQTPEWIWHSDTNASTAFFRKSFRIPPQTWNSRLTVSADDRAEIYLNGILVARCTDWRNPSRSEVTVRLNQGDNVLAVKATNQDGSRGLLVHLNVGGQTNFVSDTTWLTSAREEANWSAFSFNASHWSPAATFGPHGIQPWGDVLFRPKATDPESIQIIENFKVELLRSAEPSEGSWICMTFDDKGRIIVSPQGEQRRLLRMTIDSGKIAKVESIPAPVTYAMGLLQAFDSLYVNGIGPQGSGLYRLIDTNRNDQYETNEVGLLKRFEGGSEHGYHALALGPDRKIYVLNGNGTKLPEGIAPNSPYRNFGEDALSGARDGDEEGTKAPNCHVLRTDAEGKNWELFAGGMRNAYDFDFNADGQLFTFDSDMEWDWGTPWYRPTRVLHLIAGGEYGWRDGTRMWAENYSESMPTAAYIGIGSPTGVKFGTRSNFPAKYRRALFIQDWSYGRILAVHLEPDGSTYKGDFETFLSGAPLNVTSMAFGPDGAMYFITGGRGTQSGLYQVSYTGPFRDEIPADQIAAAASSARKLRATLSSFPRNPDIALFDVAWNNLAPASNDRALKFAARVKLESLPTSVWKELAFRETNPDRAFAALLALARVGPHEEQAATFSRLREFPFNTLHEQQQMDKLRVIQVSLARHGDPKGDDRTRLIEELDAAYPSAHSGINREIARILLRLEAPGAVTKSIALLQQTKSPEEQMHYVEQLRNVKVGWEMKDREAFFSWFLKPRDYSQNPNEKYFKDVGRSFVEGAYFDRYLREFRREAIATLTAEERKQLEPILAKPLAQAQTLAANAKEFVRDWKLEDLLPELDKPREANLSRGRQAFVDAQCLSCHRFGNDGGVSGPELTGAGSKYAERDLLEAIIEPSKVINEQYQDHTLFSKDGEIFTGRLVTDSEKEVVIETDRLSGAREKVSRANVEKLRPSSLSPMPQGLVNTLSREEILDLISYLKSGTSNTR